MSKAYLLVICLLAASFTGCIGDEDLPTEKEDDIEKEETVIEEEEETITPVGEDNMTSLKKEIEDLKATIETIEAVGEDNRTSLKKEIEDLKVTIKNYENPNVYFMMDNDNDYFFYDKYGDSYYIMAIPYDTNGAIESYKWESSDPNFDDSGSNCDMTMANDEECILWFNFISLSVCDYEENQTFTVTVYDNDGNNASASYDYVYSEDLCGPPEPMITFFVEESSSGVYHVDVIKVTEQHDLTGFSFFLKDETGSTYVGGNGFGEIAMQMIAGYEHGIDTSYSGDDDQLTNRANNVSDDDGSEYPVHFSDNDRDGKLSAGDQFMVYGQGNSASGPAEAGWRLDIQMDSTGSIVASAEMS